MIIIADDEGSKDLVDYPPLNDESLCRRGYLSSGDVSFAGNGPGDETLTIGVEVKSVFEFIASRQTGRLQGRGGQVERMLSEYDQCWMLTYGAYRCDPAGYIERPVRGGWLRYEISTQRKPIKYAYFESLLISLTDAGFRCKHIACNLHDKQQVAYWIANLYAKRQKSWKDQCEAFRSFNEAGDAKSGFDALAAKLSKRQNGQDNAANLCQVLPERLPAKIVLAASIAKQFDGMGYDRALAVAKYYDGNIDRMMAGATNGEWVMVDGLGPVIAKKVQAACRGGSITSAGKKG